MVITEIGALASISKVGKRKRTHLKLTITERGRNIMLTNDEFYERILDQEERLESLNKRKKTEVSYCTKRTQARLNKISITEKAKVKVILDGEEEKFYRSDYIKYNTLHFSNIRKRNFKRYYCTSGISLEELKEIELNQMIKYYYNIKKITRKAFIMFLKSYVVVDENILMKMIDMTSDTRQQKYKKIVVLRRFKEENSLVIGNVFSELDRLSEKEIRRIKEMENYNQKIRNKI